MPDRYAQYPSLCDKVVIVTGGASGIGRAFVERFCEQGARVFFLDINTEAAEALIGHVKASGAAIPPRFLACDITDTGALTAAIHQIAAEADGIDVLINNAADDSRHELDEVTPDSWDDCMAINLKHQFFASQAAHESMAARGGGSIICLGSIAWLNNTASMIGYTTAKAAIHGLVRTLARKLGPHNIRVNALVPGWTMTERQMALWIDEDVQREIANAQCLPSNVKPNDIARMALFLAADDSAMCTQQCFIVDGGWV